MEIPVWFPAANDSAKTYQYFNNKHLRTIFPSHYVESPKILNILLELYFEKQPTKDEYLPSDRLLHLVDYASSIEGPILKGSTGPDIWCEKYDPTTETGVGFIYTALSYERLVFMKDNHPNEKFRCHDLVFWFTSPREPSPLEFYNTIMLGIYQDQWQKPLEEMYSYFWVDSIPFHAWRGNYCEKNVFKVVTDPLLGDGDKDTLKKLQQKVNACCNHYFKTTLRKFRHPQT